VSQLEGFHHFEQIVLSAHPQQYRASQLGNDPGSQSRILTHLGSDDTDPAPYHAEDAKECRVEIWLQD
jgi:hypothetical protein